ncbi:MAG: fold metallo-hydrolase [Herbinix sp.]|jgi:L-ascorbate metabolism protein UlaG (beta-lactamase superfamily)|nr:fold metallo-hydrolase [Herbinix sp.]
MWITYIGHSGFLMEWETCYWLFDYYKGEIPQMAPDKKIFVFASHKHADHFNPDIFNLSQKYPNVVYLLSSDIKLREKDYSKLGITPELLSNIHSVKPANQYEEADNNNHMMMIKTLKSTDSGVAFLLHYQGKTVYHAGDLNLWMWKGESSQYNNNMKARFEKEMELLKDVPIDVAFAPLDPRQEEYYYLGLERLVNTAKVTCVFPMHFWEKPSVIQQYKKERLNKLNLTEVMEVSRDGQQWEIVL